MCLSYSPVQSMMPDSIQVFYPAIQPGVPLRLVQALSAWEDTKPGPDQALEDWIGLSSINTPRHVSLRGLRLAFSLKKPKAEACSHGRRFPPCKWRSAGSPPPRLAPPSTAACTPASAPDTTVRRCGRWTWRETPWSRCRWGYWSAPLPVRGCCAAPCRRSLLLSWR